MSNVDTHVLIVNNFSKLVLFQSLTRHYYSSSISARTERTEHVTKHVMSLCMQSSWLIASSQLQS